MLENPYAYILMPVGAGKTVVTLTACDYWRRAHNYRTLVIGTLRIAENVWPREVHEWGHLKHLEVAVATGTPTNRQQAIESDAAIVTINYENLPWLLLKYDIPARFDVVIFDEITKMKAPGSKRWRVMKSRIPYFKRRVGLTGTPTSNGLIDLFGQVYCVDGGASLGEYFTRFRKEHFDAEIKPNYVVYHPKEGALEDIFDKIRPVTYQMDPDKYELPELMTTVHRATMPAAVAEKYGRIQDEFVLELADDTIVADSTAAMSMKLQQIAGGFIYTENRDARWLGDHKLDVLRDILEGRHGQPTLVVYRFRAELERLLHEIPAPHLGGHLSTKNAQALIDQWNRGELPVMYIHPQSAGHGLNLQHGGDTIVWFGLPWSLEGYEQTIGRLHRTGQRAGTVWNHIIATDETIDHMIASALARKRNVKEAAIDYLKALTRDKKVPI